MKVKSILAVSLLAAGAAFADTTEVETSYVMGVFPLTVGKQAIINIPWIEAGADASDASATIAVTNLIKTATLKAGDQLFYYDGSGYKAWYVDGDGDAVKVWKPYTEATVQTVSVGAMGDLKVLERGRALILNRAASYSDNSTTNVYIVGQYTSAAAPTISIGNGYTLLAPPVVTNVNLVAYDWSDAAEGDQLIIGMTNRYELDDNGAWGQYTYNTTTKKWSFETAETIQIPAGSGIFYYHTGDAFNFSWDTGAASVEEQ